MQVDYKCTEQIPVSLYVITTELSNKSQETQDVQLISNTNVTYSLNNDSFNGAYFIADLKNYSHYHGQLVFQTDEGLNATREIFFCKYTWTILLRLTPFLLSIATYHVQDLLVSTYEYNNGSFLLKCLFAAGSTAETCLVTFTHNVQGFVESFTVGSKAELISLSVSGNYTVRVYDIINGFIIGPSIEYKFEVQSGFILPPPSSIPIISSTAITVSGIIVIVHFFSFIRSAISC